MIFYLIRLVLGLIKGEIKKGKGEREGEERPISEAPPKSRAISQGEGERGGEKRGGKNDRLARSASRSLQKKKKKKRKKKKRQAAKPK